MATFPTPHPEWTGRCRTPDIVIMHATECFRYPDPQKLAGGLAEWFTKGDSRGWFHNEEDDSEHILWSGPNLEHEGHFFYAYYGCLNCGGSASQCPMCKSQTCNSHMSFTMFGHIPLACRTCRPDGVRTAMTINTMTGLAGAGNEIYDDEVKAALRGEDVI